MLYHTNLDHHLSRVLVLDGAGEERRRGRSSRGVEGKQEQGWKRQCKWVWPENETETRLKG